MGQKIVDNLGKWGFHVILIFGLLHYPPISDTLGVELTTNFKIACLCMFFGCVLFAGDKVIANAEKNSGAIVRIFVWISDIMGSIKNSIKKKDDGTNT